MISLSSPNNFKTAEIPDTPRGLIQWATIQFEHNELFYGHGTDNAGDEAVFIVLRSLSLPFDVSDRELDRKLLPDQKNRIIALVNERINTRKPAAYLLGEAWFAGLCFYINENVLVPRSPIAELILDKFSPWCEESQVRNILDIGTGSGCIAIAAAFAFPAASVDAIDISPEALAVAKKNVKQYALEQRVNVIHSDLFSKLAGKQYDLIIANPPYVNEEDMQNLPEEFLHEPASGLSAGKDGLDIVRRILDQAAPHLTANGVLVVEVGNSEQALVDLYPELPFLWLEFEHGGEGVFLLTRNDLHNSEP